MFAKSSNYALQQKLVIGNTSNMVHVNSQKDVLASDDFISLACKFTVL